MILIKNSLITQELFKDELHKVDVLRLDLVHPEVSGNKWFKLKLNLQKALELENLTLLTFGGPHSNHIAATAALTRMYGLKSVGIIRGKKEYEGIRTLEKAKEDGMQLHFISREEYRNKNRPEFLKALEDSFGNFYLIPEGGNNSLGVTGCKEMVQPYSGYDYLLCACGTGTTFAGLWMGKNQNQVLIGINVLKGNNQMLKEVRERLGDFGFDSTIPLSGNEELNKTCIEQSCITDQYAFSGYAGYEQTLIDFKRNFEKNYEIPLDYIYTTKLFYAFSELKKLGKLKKGSSVLIIHSGGLQGNEGFEKRYHKKLSL